MHIAQVSPLYESVPPKLYGGTERIVSILSEGLVQAGHDVTLFASGESLCSGRLIQCCHTPLRGRSVQEPFAAHIYMFEQVKALAHEFDVIHFHTEYLHFNMVRDLDTSVVTTLHGRLDLNEYDYLFEEFCDLSLISISMNQRSPFLSQNWLGNVYHGIPKHSLKFSERHEGYLAFLGRLSPEKGLDDAIEIATKTGLKLKVAAKIEKQDEMSLKVLQEKLSSPGVEYIGEIGDAEKSAFLGGAAALLFPIQWPEPFGIVMIESLAAGTPVIAYRAGSVPEIIRNEETGFIVNNVEEACEAVDEVIYRRSISRKACRNDFEKRFTSDRMVRDYQALYQRVLSRNIEIERNQSLGVF